MPTKRLLDGAAAAATYESTRDPDYIHTAFAQAYLPVRDPGEGARDWERKNGHVRLRVEAGSVFDNRSDRYLPVGLPYGPRARIVMIHLTTQAVQSASPVIEVEDSLTAFVRRVGLNTDGKSINAVKEQLRRLSAATIRMTLVDGEGNGSRTVQGQIVEAMDVWAPADPRQRMLWRSTIRLSDRFYETVRKHAVPLNHEAVGALSNSALALDCYAWLAQRMHRVQGKQFIPWRSLHEQFGSGVVEVWKFRQNFLGVLKRVSAVYPAASRIEEKDGGLVIPRAAPPIPKKIND